MNIGIIGSRNFTDYNKFLFYMQSQPLISMELQSFGRLYTFISGGAVGTDALARKYAEENSIDLVEILPDYLLYESNPKYAPIARNKEIVDRSDWLIIFWDGKSNGTKSVIEMCISSKKMFLLCPVN